MKKSILIIEDDQFLRDLISLKLDKEGYRVLKAIDTQEGLKKAKEEMPDLILLDLLLPGMNGFEFLALIKQDQDLVKIPVIILSNLGQEEEIQKGFKLGAIDYLIKAHFTPEEIVEKIQKFI